MHTSSASLHQGKALEAAASVAALELPWTHRLLTARPHACWAVVQGALPALAGRLPHAAAAASLGFPVGWGLGFLLRALRGNLLRY